MGAGIDQPEIADKRQFRAAAHDDHLEQLVVRQGVRRDLHAAAEIGRVGDSNQRDRRLDRLAVVDGHAYFLEAVADQFAHRVEEEDQLARETAVPLGRVDGPRRRARDAEAGDVCLLYTSPSPRD